jgi:hypothetical protein
MTNTKPPGGPCWGADRAAGCLSREADGLQGIPKRSSAQGTAFDLARHLLADAAGALRVRAMAVAEAPEWSQ